MVSPCPTRRRVVSSSRREIQATGDVTTDRPFEQTNGVYPAVSWRMTGWHRAFQATLNQVQRRGFWSGWRRDVQRHCRQCVIYSSYHRGRLPRTGPLQPMIVGTTMEKCHVDRLLEDLRTYWRVWMPFQSRQRPLLSPTEEQRRWRESSVDSELRLLFLPITPESWMDNWCKKFADSWI